MNHRHHETFPFGRPSPLLVPIVDAGSRVESPLRGKPTAVVGASTGLFGAVWAQAEARKVLSTIGARVVDSELPVPEGDERFDADGTLRDAEVAERLAEILAELVDVAEARAAGLAARAAA